MRVIRAFSLTEKTIFLFFVLLFIGSSLSLLYQVNKNFLVEVPDYGGTLVEGVVGSPRFINPLLASSDVDRDLSALVYSGLLKVDSEGNLIPDLAESYTISDDSLTYTFTLKDNVYFHDGTRVTPDDVIFTVEKAQDPALKSPREANWAGVKAEKIDERTVSFTLKQPYSPFIQNTTLGILPRNIWRTASIEEFPFSQFNTRPVGSGPYMIDSISYTGSGLPSEYRLKSFDEYSLGQPYISTIVIKTFSNEKDAVEAHQGGNTESMHSVSSKQLETMKLENDVVMLSPLPRVFGVFFNQNVAPVLVNKEVREALDAAADKQLIVDTILGGYGQVINGPVPPNTVPTEKPEPISSETRIENARNILIAKGWRLSESGIFEKGDVKNPTLLAFSISTGDAPELKDAAFLLQSQWREMGADVEVKIFEIGDLNQNIIKPRRYDALLFGEIVGRELDLYPFWHSSQRSTPGLNIASYTNIRADRYLETIRKETDPVEQQTNLESFTREIQTDIPAVFTYAPYFIYVVPNKVQNVHVGSLTSPSERFSDVHEWYIETNNVWEIFTNEDEIKN